MHHPPRAGDQPGAASAAGDFLALNQTPQNRTRRGLGTQQRSSRKHRKALVRLALCLSADRTVEAGSPAFHYRHRPSAKDRPAPTSSREKKPAQLCVSSLDRHSQTENI